MFSVIFAEFLLCTSSFLGAEDTEVNKTQSRPSWAQLLVKEPGSKHGSNDV